jgi:hypothetical protein
MHNAKCTMQKGRRRLARIPFFLHFAVCIVNYAAVSAQQPLDRVMARIGSNAVTLTDVKAAVGLGLVDAKSPDDSSALSLAIDRQVMLIEVARFPPAEPSDVAINQQVEAMRKHAGAALPELMKSTGLDEARLRDLARDTLRIQAYIMQRFGATANVGEDDARRYYDDHKDQFTRNGQLMPFDDVLAEARKLASAAKLQDSIAQWVRDLRMRSEVVIVRSK